MLPFENNYKGEKMTVQQERYIKMFKNNKLWIHMMKKDLNLTEELFEVIPDFKVRYEIGGMNEIFRRYEEVWLREEYGIITFCSVYPRTSTCWEVSPQIYKYGTIIDIHELLKIKPIEISEEDIISLLI